MSWFRTGLAVFLTLFAVSLLASCASQSPIVVYLTPTPAQLPTLEGQESEPIQEQFGSSVEVAAIQATALPTQTIPAGPTRTWIGPVIGPGYQLPPTFPPAATDAPVATTGAVATATTDGTPPAVTTGTELFPDILPDLDRARMGLQLDINLDRSDWDDAMYRMNEHLTLGWVKIQLSWRDAQPNSPGELSDYWQRTKLYLEDADRRGFRILLSVVKAPSWSRPGQNGDGPPDDSNAYGAFITQILNESGSYIDAIEVWNEPNLQREWIGTLPFNGSGYMRLFVAAYSAIRAYSPNITIVTAGLAPTGDNPGSRDDRTFMREMYAAGLANYHDIAFGAHPYSWSNPPEATCCASTGWDNDPHFFFADNLRDYRQIMVENGHSDVQIWITEFGYGTWDGFPGSPADDGNDWILRNDKWDQANFTIRAFQIAQQQSFIGPVILWNLNFATLAGLIENGDERAAYSLLIPGESGDVIVGSPNRTERPLYWMIYDAIRPEANLDTYD